MKELLASIEKVIDRSQMLKVGGAAEVGFDPVTEELKAVKQTPHTPLVDELWSSIRVG